MRIIVLILLGCMGFMQVSSQSVCATLDSGALQEFDIQDTRVVNSKVKSSKMIKFWVRMLHGSSGNRVIFDVKWVKIMTNGASQVRLECLDSAGNVLSAKDEPVSGTGFQKTKITQRLKGCSKLLVKVKKAAGSGTQTAKRFSMKSCITKCPAVNVSLPVIMDTFNVYPDVPRGVGSYLEFSCSDELPYKLVGSPTANCVMSGDRAIWDAPPPTCERITCPSREANWPLLQTVTNSDVPLGTGSVIEYSCDAGYYMTGLPNATCIEVEGQDNGTWSGPEPTCTRIICPNIEANWPLLQRSLDSAPWETGSVIEYSCDAGYYRTGVPNVTCNEVVGQDDGEWSGPEPNCTRITCDELPVFPPLNVSSFTPGDPDVDLATGTSVTFSCEPGYDLDGDATIMCDQIPGTETAEWTNNPPTCELAVGTCDAVAVIPPLYASTNQANADHDWALGTKVTFSCATDLNLIGAAAIECYDAAGTYFWNDTVPSCEYPAAFICGSVPVALPLIANVTQGNEFQDWAFGTVVSFSCAAGFTLVGQATMICEEFSGDADWTAAPPSCQALGR